MNNVLLQLTIKSFASAFTRRSFSVSATRKKTHSCKLLIVGGGSGGCSLAAKFVRNSKAHSVIILEPSTNHYYQPLWTLVGAGAKDLESTRRDMRSVLPKGALWIEAAADKFAPEQNTVTATNGDVFKYEYMIVAVGMQMNYSLIPGLTEALNEKNFSVATIYDSKYVSSTFELFKKFKGGEAVFTFPQCPIKCPGAPQKIAYLADSYFSKTGVRSKGNITYHTSLPVIFGVKKYADELLKVVDRKKIKVRYRSVLKELKPDKKEAIFNVFKGDDPKPTTESMKYDMLHVTPPMSPPDCLKKSPLADMAGFLDVDKHTLQHTKYPNVYGIGDCTNTPNSKTAAAVACQGYVVHQNLLDTMRNQPPRLAYDGYGACPLVTSYNKCILAEFIYGGAPYETMPFNQAVESRLAFYMKRDLFPFLYWNFMLKGTYNGPKFVRKIINPFGWN